MRAVTLGSQAAAQIPFLGSREAKLKETTKFETIPHVVFFSQRKEAGSGSHSKPPPRRSMVMTGAGVWSVHDAGVGANISIHIYIYILFV